MEVDDCSVWPTSEEKGCSTMRSLLSLKFCLQRPYSSASSCLVSHEAFLAMYLLFMGGSRLCYVATAYSLSIFILRVEGSCIFSCIISGILLSMFELEVWKTVTLALRYMPRQAYMSFAMPMITFQTLKLCFSRFLIVLLWVARLH
jgi:hypothetical protein